jgi:hypothetical protein
MVLVKRNSAEFKEIAAIFDAYAGKPGGRRSLKLFALKPYEALDQRIAIPPAKKAAYDLTYDIILDYLKFNKAKKLFRANPRLYYFKSNSNSDWKEYPFELSASLQRKVRPLQLVKD